MLVAATLTTKTMQLLAKRWKLEGGLPPVVGQKAFSGPHSSGAAPGAAPAGPPPDIPLTWKKVDYKLPPEGALEPSVTKDADYRGGLVVFDWETKDVVWESNWGDYLVTPHGFCFADGGMYVNDLEAAHCFKVSLDEPGKLLERISHPALNDLHSVVRTSRGLLLTCSGDDVIIELDMKGNALWEWWAYEHGLDMTPVGKRRETLRGTEQRDQYYHTRYQSTHVNNANVYGANDRYVVTTLFHQGMAVRIDRERPEAEQNVEIVTSGLARPHGPMPYDGGWIVANSLGKELVLLDHTLKVTRRLPYDGGWIQDAHQLSNGNIVINDVDNHVMVELATPGFDEVYRVKYDDNWRMGELKEVPREHEAAFRTAGKVGAASA